MTTFGTVVGPNGFKREFETVDLEWAVKMIFREAGSEADNMTEWAAILWTTTSRWASGHFRRPEESYGAFIRRFSQPINPRWLQGGAFDPHPFTETTTEQFRAWLQTVPLSYFIKTYPHVVAFAAKFLRGEVPVNGFVGIVDFAAPDVAPGEDDVSVYVPGVSGNAFYKATWSLGWDENTVRILRPSGLATAGVGLLFGGLAFSIYLSLQKSRGQ